MTFETRPNVLVIGVIAKTLAHGTKYKIVHGFIPPAAVAQMNARGKKLPEGRQMPCETFFKHFQISH